MPLVRLPHSSQNDQSAIFWEDYWCSTVPRGFPIRFDACSNRVYGRGSSLTSIKKKNSVFP